MHYLTLFLFLEKPLLLIRHGTSFLKMFFCKVLVVPYFNLLYSLNLITELWQYVCVNVSIFLWCNTAEAVCVAVLKKRCLKALQNKSCWLKREPLMKAHCPIQVNCTVCCYCCLLLLFFFQAFFFSFNERKKNRCGRVPSGLFPAIQLIYCWCPL